MKVGPCHTRIHDWGTDPSTGRPRCQRCFLFGDHRPNELRDRVVLQEILDRIESAGVLLTDLLEEIEGTA